MNIKKILIASIIVTFASANAQKTPGINTSYMDVKTKPSEDFYRFVNGTWLDKTDIPADKNRWGSFDELRLNTDKDALAILKDAAKNPIYNSNTDQGKAVNLFQSILDTVSRDKQGMSPLKPYLTKIDKLKNIKDLEKLLIEMAPLGGIGFLGIGVGADEENSNKNSVSIYPGSLGLPDKDYYMSTDKDSKEKRAKYLLHLTKMMTYLESSAKAKISAKQILDLETEMSSARLDRVESRNSRLQYNPMTLNELQKITPAINWKNYFTTIGFKDLNSVIVTQPKYMKALQNIFANNKIESWKAYLKWTLLDGSSNELSSDVEKTDFDFFGKILTGSLKQRPREQRALQSVNGAVGEALGKLYVEKMFPADAKTKAVAMIKNVIKAYEIRINNLTWMSPETKVKAIEKLNKITVKVGYPDKWEDYSSLTIKNPKEGGSFFENNLSLARWQFKKDLDKLNKPVDKSKWGMSPQTVNAYYNPSYNEIVFPAAILQPPFYNYQADEAVNYGGIGAVIGHEISHGFDDQGATYNADGNLVDWWTKNDLEQFTALGTALADQYSALEPLPGIKVDGKFTLGENIGDLGGVNAAYDGLKLYLKENVDTPTIDGYTPEQRFFISWATIWRSKIRDEAMKNQVKTDPHSPGIYRAYVPIQNLDVFYDAFGIKENDKMFIKPEKRVRIW